MWEIELWWAFENSNLILCLKHNYLGRLSRQVTKERRLTQRLCRHTLLLRFLICIYQSSLSRMSIPRHRQTTFATRSKEKPILMRLKSQKHQTMTFTTLRSCLPSQIISRAIVTTIAWATAWCMSFNTSSIVWNCIRKSQSFRSRIYSSSCRSKKACPKV